MSKKYYLKYFLIFDKKSLAAAFHRRSKNIRITESAEMQYKTKDAEINSYSELAEIPVITSLIIIYIMGDQPIHYYQNGLPIRVHATNTNTVTNIWYSVVSGFADAL
jgi:hypothetical protein